MKKRTSTRSRIPSVLIGVVAILGAFIVLYVMTTQLRAAPPKQKTPITISTAEWSPYIGPQLEDNGPWAKIISDVFQQIGYQPKFDFSTWDIAEEDVKTGASLAVGPVVDADYRNDFGVYSDEVMRFEYVLFGKKGPQLTRLGKGSNLEGAKVAKIEGYKYWSALEGSGAQFESFPTSVDAFNALARGDVDLVAEGKLAGEAVLRGRDFRYSAEDFEVLSNSEPFNSNIRGLHLFVSDLPESREILELFNEALKEYKDTSEYRDNVSAINSSKTYANLNAPHGKAITIELQDNQKKLQVPRKSKVLVLDWPRPGENRDWASVKVLNGPDSGIVGRVSVDDVELSDG